MVDLYVRQGNIPGAAILLYIAVRKRVSLSELMRFTEKLGVVIGEYISRQRVHSFLTTWRTHRYIETVSRGVYTVGPNLDLSDLEKAKQILAQHVPELDKILM